MNIEFQDSDGNISRRQFLKDTMWTALLALASLNSFTALTTPALAADGAAAAAIVPKELVFNPLWWNRLYAFMMGITEVPLLEATRETVKTDTDAEMFRRIGLLGSELNWGTRVVPIKKAIHHKTEILPYQEFEELISRSNVIGIGVCWCRTTFKNCDAPTSTCIHLGFGENRLDLMDRGHVAKVTREEIRDVIKKAEDAGLVHELIRVGDDDSYYVICNCCPCCCVGLRGLIAFGNKMVTRSEFVAMTTDNCTGCEKCLKRCHFSARKVADGKSTVDSEKCMGCGLCATGCPSEGAFLVKRDA
ncbi:MAG: 4Fe-4S binding protein [bacterium]